LEERKTRRDPHHVDDNIAGAADTLPNDWHVTPTRPPPEWSTMIDDASGAESHGAAGSAGVDEVPVAVLNNVSADVPRILQRATLSPPC
jgi:hypothetical protein